MQENFLKKDRKKKSDRKRERRLWKKTEKKEGKTERKKERKREGIRNERHKNIIDKKVYSDIYKIMNVANIYWEIYVQEKYMNKNEQCSTMLHYMHSSMYFVMPSKPKF